MMPERDIWYRPRRPCRRCGTPAQGRLCRPCWNETRPPPAPPRIKTQAEKVRRAAFVADWRANVGDWCPGYRRAGHAVVPPNVLTADHIHPVAAGGAEDGELAILCNRCNASKRDGQRTGRTVVRRPPTATARRDDEIYTTIHSRTW